MTTDGEFKALQRKLEVVEAQYTDMYAAWTGSQNKLGQYMRRYGAAEARATKAERKVEELEELIRWVALTIERSPHTAVEILRANVMAKD